MTDVRFLHISNAWARNYRAIERPTVGIIGYCVLALISAASAAAGLVFFGKGGALLGGLLGAVAGFFAAIAVEEAVDYKWEKRCEMALGLLIVVGIAAIVIFTIVQYIIKNWGVYY